MTDKPMIVDESEPLAVKRRDGTTQYFRSFMEAVFACERCETKHNLAKAENGGLIPTMEFLADLATQFSEMGIADCSPDLAYKLWIGLMAKLSEEKKSAS